MITIVQLRSFSTPSSVEKLYIALVDGVVEKNEGTIEARIGRFAELKYWGVKADGKHSESRFWVRERHANTTLIELEPGPFTIELERQRLEGVALRMPHLDHSLGYRLRGHARTVAYSGDTGMGEAPVELGKGADVYVLEAALPEGSETTRHLTPSCAARVAAAAGVKELVLTHFYPETERTDVRALAREHFLGALVLGYDGLRLPL